MSKRCNKCGCTKDAALFSKDRRQKDGLQTYCKPCRKSGNKQWRASNLGQVRAHKKKWYADNRQTAIEYSQSYRSENKQQVLDSAKTYRENHKQSIRDYNKTYKTQYIRDRRRSDPHFKMLDRLRTRTYHSLGRYSDVGSVSSDIGCTIAELWAHLESQFKPGMTRDNWGKVWEVDHIFPLAKIKRGCRTEFLAAANWRNLQPLTPDENNAKNDTVTPEAQVLFDALCQEFLAHATQQS